MRRAEWHATSEEEHRKQARKRNADVLEEEYRNPYCDIQDHHARNVHNGNDLSGYWDYAAKQYRGKKYPQKLKMQERAAKRARY